MVAHRTLLKRCKNMAAYLNVITPALACLALAVITTAQTSNTLEKLLRLELRQSRTLPDVTFGEGGKFLSLTSVKLEYMVFNELEVAENNGKLQFVGQLLGRVEANFKTSRVAYGRDLLSNPETDITEKLPAFINWRASDIALAFTVAIAQDETCPTIDKPEIQDVSIGTAPIIEGIPYEDEITRSDKYFLALELRREVRDELIRQIKASIDSYNAQLECKHEPTSRFARLMQAKSSVQSYFSRLMSKIKGIL